jgi:competence protein ComEC
MAGADTGWRLAGLALAWLAGVALHLQERSLQPAWVYALVAVGGLALTLLGLQWRRCLAPALLGTALLGIGVSGGHASIRIAESLAPRLEGRDLLVTGVVASLPQTGPSGLRFRFRIDEARLDGQAVQVPPLVVLGWYKGFHEDDALAEPHAELRAGQRWRFTARLRRPHGNINPHGFDYELYLFEQGVRATGYVRDAPAFRLDGQAGFAIERLRQRVRDAIDAAVPDDRSAGVLAALAVGDQGAIGREDWDLFRNTGIAHLVSISGLHVTMFAWMAGIGIAALWRRSARAMLWLPLPQAARWGGLLAATGYALLAGWGVPAQRTVWMLATVTLLREAGLRWPWVIVLLAAAVVVTVFDPWALLQAGFWLSFMAVGLLMASEPVLRAQRGDNVAQAGGWRRWLGSLRAGVAHGFRTQVLVTLGLTPLTLVFFQQLSAVGLLANLMSIPLVTLLITPLALLGTLWAPLWSLGAWLVQQLSQVLGWLAALPGAIWLVPVAPTWAQLAGLLAAVLLVLPLPWRARAMALPLLLPLLMPPRGVPPPGEFELLVADVGQGTAVLVRTHRHLLVYDAGPRYSRESSAGERVLLPLLRARGEPQIDVLLLSHRDTDHVGGAPALLAGMPVRALLSSLDASHPVLQTPRPSQRCEAGQQWAWDGVQFEVLSPQPTDYLRGLKPNALSCVLRVGTPGRSVLLTGDVERDQEVALVAAHAAGMRSDVLLVPHHGSGTSSTTTFLAAVQPRVAVIQAGYRNRFGHPAAGVLARLRERGIQVLASADCGAWQWFSDGAPHGLCLREHTRRYWRRDATPPGT